MSEAAVLTQNSLDLQTRKAREPLVGAERIDQDLAYPATQIVRRVVFGGNEKRDSLEVDVQETGIFSLSAKAAIRFSVSV